MSEPPTDPAYRPVTASDAPASATYPPSPNVKMLVPLAIGAAVATAVGVYGRVHEPTHVAVNLAGFSTSKSSRLSTVMLAAISSAVVATREPVTMISGCDAGSATPPSAARRIQIKGVSRS